MSLSGAYDAVTFNSAMDACVKGGAPREAVALFLHMCRGGVGEGSTPWWTALDSLSVGATFPALPLVTGVRPDGLSYRILIEALDSGQNRVVDQFGSTQLLVGASHRAALVFASGVQRAIFQPFSLGSYSAVLASDLVSNKNTLSLGCSWLPPRLGLVDLHGFSESSAKAAVRYALTSIGAFAVVEHRSISALSSENTSIRDAHTAARVEATLEKLVGPSGLIIVTGHGQRREGPSTLPTSIRALCEEGLAARRKNAANKENTQEERRKRSGPGFVDPTLWHRPVRFQDMPENPGAFSIPLSELMAVASGCINEWQALKEHETAAFSEPPSDPAVVTMALLRSRALWEAVVYF